MGKFLAALIIILFFGFIISLPLYFCVNLVLLLFHISYHITLLQAFAICLLISVVKNMFFNNKGGE